MNKLLLLPGSLGIIKCKQLRSDGRFLRSGDRPFTKTEKEMMITTTLAPIQEAEYSNENSVISARNAYQSAKIDYQILEQQVRNTPIDQFNLLVQLNCELVAVAQKMEAALAAWSDELDRFLDVSVKLDPLPTRGLRLIDGCFHDSHGGRTLVLK